MERTINIYSRDQHIDLGAKEYKIDIVGGWGVKLNQFAILFIHTQSDKVIKCEKSFWPIQSFDFNKRAKRVFVFNVEEAGVYTVVFRNQETLQVKESNLFLRSMLQKPIPNSEVFVYIH